MMQIRRSHERGRAKHGWLDSHHTFSFADYYDPRWMGYRALRVLNEDRVAPSSGFPPHPHRSMEIISYVLEGALEHKDSMGNGSIIRPGDVQLMSAGDGVRHSEHNHDSGSLVHFLQIWIQPNADGGTPGYQQQAFPAAERDGRWRLLVSPSGADGSLIIKQDVSLHGANLAPGEELTTLLAKGRGAWVHVARGVIEANGERLEAGDAAAVDQVEAVHVKGVEAAEVLLFDLA